MKLNPHLSFNGNCAAAYRYYAQHLGAKILFSLTYGASPLAAQFPAECSDQIMHATLEVGGVVVLGLDNPPGAYQKPDGFCLTLSFDEAGEAERVFQALAANGKVSLPLQQTFWAVRFGMLVDQFGIPWMINCGTPTASH